MAKIKIGREAQDPVVEQNVHQERPVDTKPKIEDFDLWWASIHKKKKLNPDLKKAVQIYFDRKGYLVSGDFDAGLKEFGVV